MLERNRGKRNEPAYVTHIAQKVAEYYNMELEELERVTDKNALDIYQMN